MADNPQINFRATSGFVTDGALETYCLTADSYPTTRNGYTFGDTSGAYSDRDRDNTVDARCAGSAFETSGTLTIRVDMVDGAGDYDAAIAVGGIGASYTARDWQILDYDGTTQLTGQTGVTTSAGQFDDATGALHTTAANWVSNNTRQAITVGSGGYVFVETNYNGGGNFAINHCGFFFTGAVAGPPLLTLLGVG